MSPLKNSIVKEVKRNAILPSFVITTSASCPLSKTCINVNDMMNNNISNFLPNCLACNNLRSPESGLVCYFIIKYEYTFIS